MKIIQLLEKLEKSKVFGEFKKDNPKAFLCAGFIIMNLKQSIFESSLDFRDENDIFTFKIPEEDKEAEITMLKEEIIKNPAAPKPFEQLKEEDIKKIKLDIGDLKETSEKELKKNKITQSLEDIIAIFHKMDEKLVWHLTCMAAGFTVVNITLDANTKDVIKFEKKSLMDFVSVKKPEKK
ncbi:MAG: hypothetical protein AABX17_02940 [Nanoarchaeota archaeon]